MSTAPSDFSTITVTRKNREAIVIDGPARVEVEILGMNRVRLRTTARRTVRVLREKLLNQGDHP
ncbi:MAG: carbon storage regulator [Phycisphaerales bacterium]|jgi:sRNA-binding carbon storage regulator CsrA